MVAQEEDKRLFHALLVSPTKLFWAERGAQQCWSQTPSTTLSHPHHHLLQCSKCKMLFNSEVSNLTPPTVGCLLLPLSSPKAFDGFHNKPQCSTLPSNPTQQLPLPRSHQWTSPPERQKKVQPMNVKVRRNLRDLTKHLPSPLYRQEN